jgi:hypothetical protein
MSQEATNALMPYPLYIDFLNKEACIVGHMTVLKYRNKGIAAYSNYVRLKYLGEHGILKVRGLVDIRHQVGHGHAEKVGARRYAKGQYVKIFFWHSWKETPLI